MGNQTKAKNINLTKKINFFFFSLIPLTTNVWFKSIIKNNLFSYYLKLLGIVTSTIGILNMKSFDTMEKFIKNQ